MDSGTKYRGRLVLPLNGDPQLLHVADFIKQGSLKHYEVIDDKIYYYLTNEEYVNQIYKANDRWLMPEIGYNAYFDDQYEEEVFNKP